MNRLHCQYIYYSPRIHPQTDRPVPPCLNSQIELISCVVHVVNAKVVSVRLVSVVLKTSGEVEVDGSFFTTAYKKGSHKRKTARWVSTSGEDDISSQIRYNVLYGKDMKKII